MEIMKLTDKRISLEMTILVLIEFDTGLVAVCALCDHTELGEDVVKLIDSDIVGE